MQFLILLYCTDETVFCGIRAKSVNTFLGTWGVVFQLHSRLRYWSIWSCTPIPVPPLCCTWHSGNSTELFQHTNIPIKCSHSSEVSFLLAYWTEMAIHKSQTTQGKVWNLCLVSWERKDWQIGLNCSFSCKTNNSMQTFAWSKCPLVFIRSLCDGMKSLRWYLNV